jgi:hypothetical protein
VGGSQTEDETADLSEAIIARDLKDFKKNSAKRRAELGQRLTRQGYGEYSPFVKQQMDAFDRREAAETARIIQSGKSSALRNQGKYSDIKRQEEEDAENRYRFDMALGQAEQQDEINRYANRQNLYIDSLLGDRRVIGDTRSFKIEDLSALPGFDAPQGPLPTRAEYIRGNRGSVGEAAGPAAAGPAAAGPGGNQRPGRIARPQAEGRSAFSIDTKGLFRLQTKEAQKEIDDKFEQERGKLSAELIRRGYAPSSSVYQSRMNDLSKNRDSAVRNLREQGWDQTFGKMKSIAESQRSIDKSNEEKYRFDLLLQKALQRDRDQVTRNREDLLFANRFTDRMARDPDYILRNWRTQNDIGLQRPNPIRLINRSAYDDRSNRGRRNPILVRRR